jgi:hypothetical protein
MIVINYYIRLHIIQKQILLRNFFSQLKHYIKKQSPNTYEDIDTTIKDVLANKIKKEHLTNYLKHSYRIYK